MPVPPTGGPGETYHELRQITWFEHDGRITAWIREAGAPWVSVTQSRATHARLRTYIEQYGRDQVQRAMSAAADTTTEDHR